MLISRFILNLRDLADTSGSAGLVSSPSQLRSLAFAQRSRIAGSIGLPLEYPDVVEAALTSSTVDHAGEGGGSAAHSIAPPSEAEESSVASLSLLVGEFAYLKEVCGWIGYTRFNRLSL